MCRNRETLSLGDVLDQVIDHRGKTPKKLGGDFVDHGVRVLSAKNVVGGSLDLADLRYVTPDMYERWMPTKLRIGDVLLTSEAPLGEVAYLRTDAEFCLGQRLFALRADPHRLHPRYLYYALRSKAMQDRLHARATGTTAQGIRQSELVKVAIDLPPLPEQRAIAHILGTLDDKIELNRRMNATLEEMARALFKSWFVDFDPARAKAAGRQPAGMGAATAALFPDSFEESELGEIPRGWEVKPLDQIASFLNGLAMQRHPPNGHDDLPVIKIAELRGGISASTRKASATFDPRYIVEDGDVLFSWSGTLEVEVWCGGRGALNQHLFKVASEDYPKWFYFWWIRHHLPVFRSVAAGKATTMGHIRRRHLSEALAVVPDARVLDQADEILLQITERVISNELEARILARMRDTLLPTLLDGSVVLNTEEI